MAGSGAELGLECFRRCRLGRKLAGQIVREGSRAYLALPCALPQPCCFVPRSQDIHLPSQSCRGRSDPCHPSPPCLRPARLCSLTHGLFRTSWIEVRPSWAQRPLTRLHPLWAPVFSLVWEALAWKLPRALLWSAVLEAQIPESVCLRVGLHSPT